MRVRKDSQGRNSLSNVNRFLNTSDSSKQIQTTNDNELVGTHENIETIKSQNEDEGELSEENVIRAQDFHFNGERSIVGEVNQLDSRCKWYKNKI